MPTTQPQMNEVKVVCNCKTEYVIMSTLANISTIKIDICAACHPFYTGRQKSSTDSSRAQQFLKKYGLK